MYADLGLTKKRSEAPEVDQHAVTYTTLDMAATNRMKASTMPASNEQGRGECIQYMGQRVENYCPHVCYLWFPAQLPFTIYGKHIVLTSSVWAIHYVVECLATLKGPYLIVQVVEMIIR